jgi:hypothetical protein
MLAPVGVLDAAEELPTTSMNPSATSTKSETSETTRAATSGASDFWQFAAVRFSDELCEWRQLAKYLLARELKHELRAVAMETLFRRLIDERTALRQQLERSQESLRRLMELS